jgi:hypothetical protein
MPTEVKVWECQYCGCISFTKISAIDHESLCLCVHSTRGEKRIGKNRYKEVLRRIAISNEKTEINEHVFCVEESEGG